MLGQYKGKCGLSNNDTLLYHITKIRIYIFKANSKFYTCFLTLISFALILSSCIWVSSGNSTITSELGKISPIIPIGHPIFDELEKKWVSSSYFDQGMKYKNSQLEVVFVWTRR